MDEVLEYNLLKADEQDKILEKINNASREGWKAQGGIAVNGQEEVGGNYRFYQLMVKVKTKKDNTEVTVK